jgi:uroporphyrinogen-III synthase
VLANTSGALAILTRPDGRNEPLANRLRQAGIKVSMSPALLLHPETTPAPAPGDHDLVVFVSAAAAQFYFQQLRPDGGPFSWPAATLACTVGPASARALRDVGVIPDDCIVHPGPEASEHDSEALWRLLAPRLSSIRRVLIVRGQAGREWLGRQFEDAGVLVRRYAAYRREPVVWTAEQARSLARELASSSPVVCLVTSAEGVESLRANVERHRTQLLQLWESVRFVTIHPRIASHLQSRFMAADGAPLPVRLCAPDDEAVFRAIMAAASS